MIFARLKKIAVSLAYFSLFWLTWQWLDGAVAFKFSLGAIMLSGFWLGLTFIELNKLFQSYFDIFSRLKTLMPLTIGVALSGLAIAFSSLVALKVVAALELALWLAIYLLYRRNRKRYISQGHGPLPRDAWVNPSCDVLQEGDLVLTSGRMADRLRESVGHGEVAVRLADGQLYLLSSYMEKGAIVHRADRVANALLRRGHYIVLRLTRPLSAVQHQVIPDLTEILLEQNRRWREAAQSRRTAFFNKLPLPGAARSRLIKRFRVTGYDWLGLFIGTLHQDHWTCIGLCLELYHRIGVHTSAYGTGLLGLGTGLLDPIMPVRFLGDPAFRLLTTKDREAFEKGRSADR